MSELINQILEDVGLEKLNAPVHEGKATPGPFVTRDIEEILSIIINGK